MKAAILYGSSRHRHRTSVTASRITPVRGTFAAVRRRPRILNPCVYGALGPGAVKPYNSGTD